VNSLANLEERRKRVQERLDQRWQPERINPVMEPANIRYEVSSRVSATDAGGVAGYVIPPDFGCRARKGVMWAVLDRSRGSINRESLAEAW